MIDLHCIYAPGLNDQCLLNRFLVSLLPKIWIQFGVKTHIFSPRWRSAELYVVKEKRLLVLIDSLHKQNNLIFLVGQSAGGSIVLNVFSKRKETVVGVINVAGRLCRGIKVFPTLQLASISSPAFQASVEQCEDVSEKTLRKDDRKRIMTIRPIWDEVVPSLTVSIAGARNDRVPLFEHTLGGCGILLFYCFRLFSFIKNICLDKVSVRKIMIARRKELSLPEKKHSDEKIHRALIQRDEWKKANTICISVSLPEEVDTKKIMSELFLEKKIVVVPKVLKERILELFQIKSADDLSVGKFGVLEPKSHCKAVDKKSVDLFIVPGIVFDRSGNRLGWGKGYYDRLLQGVSVPKIALAYSFQIADEIPHDTHDIRMSAIITEKEVIDTFDQAQYHPEQTERVDIS
ncbi:MAG: 5-formyltetrahydrofolate cyclo-ligase [Patescibacteria group bacterium]